MARSQRGRACPKPTVAVGTTSVNNFHRHRFTLDSLGNGRTTFDGGHSHVIVSGVVSADPRNGHKHALRNVELLGDDEDALRMPTQDVLTRMKPAGLAGRRTSSRRTRSRKKK